MGEVLDDLARLALFESWGEGCVWCGRPLFFDEMEVEHLLPKSLRGDDRVAVLEAHGRGADFDLQALENSAPSCGPCNRGKGSKPPPAAPIITTLLQTAEERAPEIRQTAERSRGSRRLQRALPVVLAAAEAEDPKAIAALRNAANELALEFRQTTGREIQRVHSALRGLTDVGEFLNTSDTSFFYPATTHVTDGPAPPVTPGSVMSVFETTGEVTSRIDVVPRDEDALARYGPQFTLSATDDATGERAAALLEEALREGRPVTIGEGLDVTFERLPPAFEDMVGRRLAGTVKLGAPQTSGRRSQIPEWDALMRASTQAERSAVRIRLRPPAQIPEGWDDALVGDFGGMTAAALWRQHASGGELRWNLKHKRDSSPVREQLAALEFLDALSRGGELVVVDRGKTKRPELRTPGPPATVAPGGRALLSFLRDVRAIETWAGAEFDLPDEVTGGDARHVAIIADLVRNGGRSLTWRDAHLRVPDSSVDQLRTGGVLRIEQTASALLLGRDIELGVVQKDLSAYEVVSVEPVDGDPGHVDVRIEPTDTDAADVFERLLSVKRRTRRPPSPPRKGARARRKPRGRRRKR